MYRLSNGESEFPKKKSMAGADKYTYRAKRLKLVALAIPQPVPWARHTMATAVSSVKRGRHQMETVVNATTVLR